jgi:hypothetical protein
MDNTDIEYHEKLREQIRKGLELTFKKLVRQKKAQNGVFVFSENGVIKKIKAVDLPD